MCGRYNREAGTMVVEKRPTSAALPELQILRATETGKGPRPIVESVMPDPVGLTNTGSEMFAIEMMQRRKFKVRQRACCAWRVLFAAGLLILATSAHADSDRGKRTYRENCAPCHRESGKGDGAGVRSLPVRPADHTDGKTMSSRTDAFLRDVISKGGSAMGLSTFMPAWQGILKEEEIQNLVDYIRSLALPPK